MTSRLPDFFVIGAPKAGTTSLYHYLRQHPGVYMPDVKEPAFFSSDYNYEKGLSWYLDFFRQAKESQVIGEATPWYFCNRKVIDRMTKDLPSSSWRFILAIRDPVERAYSMYWNMVRAGAETRSFENALKAEPERLTNPEVHRTGSLTIGYSYVGDYASHVARWLDTFGRERILVLLQDALRWHPGATMREVFSFLGVAPDVAVDTSIEHNPSATVRYPRLRTLWRAWRRMPKWTRGPLNLLPDRTKHRLVGMLSEANKKPWRYPPLSEATEQRLRSSFEPSISRLEQLLDLDLSRWKGPIDRATHFEEESGA